MSDKQAALEAIQRLPERASFDDIAKEIEFLAGLRTAEDQVQRGQVLPLEQLERNLEQWLSPSS
ncbi:MAG: hypothetical protein HZA90_25780 [Verrucomicrobia bacterium]|nr:hypothetical protein [Verrucomicrobiota bacterium]